MNASFGVGRGFTRGSGCYTCGSCGRRTRNVDPDAAAVLVCAQCYEIAGIENSIDDGVFSQTEGAPRLAELRAEIAAKGGSR